MAQYDQQHQDAFCHIKHPWKIAFAFHRLIPSLAALRLRALRTCAGPARAAAGDAVPCTPAIFL
ncbi:hypothetical protein D3Z52_14100 [Clostridiaceae bacterium]|nr:hypothetical protein [Clostridiaceae bacterium]